MDLRGVRSLKTKWVQNTSPEVMNSVFPKANFFLGHPVESIQTVTLAYGQQRQKLITDKPNFNLLLLRTFFRL